MAVSDHDRLRARAWAMMAHCVNLREMDRLQRASTAFRAANIGRIAIERDGKLSPEDQQRVDEIVGNFLMEVTADETPLGHRLYPPQ